MDSDGEHGPDPGDLAAWAADLRAAEAAAERRRARWWGDLARRGATVAGVLADLAERGEVVAVATAGGRVHRGRLGPAGADFCGLSGSGPAVLVRHAAIASVRVAPGQGPAARAGEPGGGAWRPLTGWEALGGWDRSPPGAGEGPGADPPTLALALDRLVGLGVEVAVRTWGPTWHGALVGAGPDVACLRLPGDGGLAYVPLGSVLDLSLGSG